TPQYLYKPKKNSIWVLDNKKSEGKSPKQCLKEGHCRALQVTFFECKRSLLDTRTRFRGRKGY
uniref:Cytochrome c oxidase assembly factor 5 n=1 Tax=Callorhinchus milii TaxID=7868 RepID=A0A4W3JW06_CALMI